MKPAKNLARRLLLSAAAAMLLTHSLAAQTASGPFQATPQRPTFTADTSTTAPGTLELENGLTFSEGLLVWPFNIKFTPEVSRGPLRSAEFSVSFDGLVSESPDGKRDTRFGDAIGFVIRRPVYAGKRLSLAVAPRAIFLLRDGEGARLGIRALAAYSAGRNTIVANWTWTSATRPSAASPAQQYDTAVDLAHVLGESGVLGRIAVFAGVQHENPSGSDSRVSLGQGIAYRVRPNLVLDVAVREEGIAAGPKGYQILVGFTFNGGRIRDW